MSFELPPVVKLAERLLIDIELAVRKFARYFKYTFGSDLRAAIMNVTRLAHRAWRDRQRQAIWLKHLVRAVDDLKITLQLGSRIQAFASFGQFEALARSANMIGKQVGGWNRQQQHPKSQNAAPSKAPQRALHHRFPWLHCATAQRKFDYRHDGSTVVFHFSKKG